MTVDKTKLVRCAVYTHPTKRTGDRTRPTYGVPQPDGTLLEEDGTVIAAGDWYRSRPSNLPADDEGDE